MTQPIYLHTPTSKDVDKLITIHDFYTKEEGSVVFDMGIDFLRRFFTISIPIPDDLESNKIAACLSCTVSLDKENDAVIIVIQF